MTVETYRSLGGLLFIEAVMWTIGCLGHYFKGEIWLKGKKRLNAPGWLRKLFGDFRREGTLSVSDTIIQGFCYITALVAFLFLLGPGLTTKTAMRLWFLQFFLTGIVIGLIRDVIPRLSRRGH